MAADVAATLEPGRAYSWDELAPRFGFQPGYFAVAGGMVPSAATGSLLLITHPGGGKSFDYNDCAPAKKTHKNARQNCLRMRHRREAHR